MYNTDYFLQYFFTTVYVTSWLTTKVKCSNITYTTPYLVSHGHWVGPVRNNRIFGTLDPHLLCPRPIGGHYRLSAVSVCLSVACIGLSREQKDVGSPKLTQGSPYHTNNPCLHASPYCVRSVVYVGRSPSRFYDRWSHHWY